MCGGSQEVQPHCAARHAETREWRRQTGCNREEWEVWEAAGLERLLLQATLEHRLQTNRRTAHDAGLRHLARTSPQASRSTEIWSITTGIGFGISATATLETRACTRWTWPGGRWAARCPKSVISLGGRYVDTPNFKDQGETPNQLVSVFDFGGTLLLFETRGLVANKKVPDFPNKVANELYFEEGVVKDNKFFPKGKTQGEPLVSVEFEPPSGGMFGNFIECIRSRKREKLAADILEGHLSSAIGHLGNISYRLAKERPFEKPSDFSDNSVVGDSIMTLLANTKAIGVDPEKATLWVGPKLQFDPEKEKFVNNPEADKLLTRNYRPPFVVPEKV